jgi:hypothetical protein
LLRIGCKKELIPDIDSIINDLRKIEFRLPDNVETLEPVPKPG